MTDTIDSDKPVQRENILSRRRSRVRATRHDLQEILPKRRSKSRKMRKKTAVS